MVKRKRVLIITYYWPPSGSSGVQRTLYFVKYLRDFGWEPVVYIPENPEYPAIDNSLSREIPVGIEIIKHTVWEPYQFYKRFLGKSSSEVIKPQVVMEKQKGFKNWLTVFIRGNFFIPDARMFWIRPSVRFLAKYLKKHPVDMIYSSSPPQSVHLIALKLKARTGIPWVADFRDPWTKISYFEHLHLSPFARKRHEHLEKLVLNSANAVVTVSRSCASDFEMIGGRQVLTVTNGFDGAMPDLKNEAPKEFSLTYLGTLTKSRIPEHFWRYLHKALNDTGILPAFRLKMIGNIEESVFQDIVSAGLEEHLLKIPYLSHDLVASELQSAFALLLIGIPNDKGVLTGKLFEYMQSMRPILCVGPKNGDLEDFIKDPEFGFYAPYEDQDLQKKAIENLIGLFQHPERWNPASEKVMKYHRKELTSQLADIFNAQFH